MNGFDLTERRNRTAGAQGFTVPFLSSPSLLLCGAAFPPPPLGGAAFSIGAAFSPFSFCAVLPSSASLGCSCFLSLVVWSYVPILWCGAAFPSWVVLFSRPSLWGGVALPFSSFGVLFALLVLLGRAAFPSLPSDGAAWPPPPFAWCCLPPWGGAAFPLVLHSRQMIAIRRFQDLHETVLQHINCRSGSLFTIQVREQQFTCIFEYVFIMCNTMHSGAFSVENGQSCVFCDNLVVPVPLSEKKTIHRGGGRQAAPPKEEGGRHHNPRMEEANQHDSTGYQKKRR